MARSCVDKNADLAHVLADDANESAFSSWSERAFECVRARFCETEIGTLESICNMPRKVVLSFERDYGNHRRRLAAVHWAAASRASKDLTIVLHTLRK